VACQAVLAAKAAFRRRFGVAAFTRARAKVVRAVDSNPHDVAIEGF